MQKLLHVFGQTDLVVQVLGVLNLVLVQLVHQVEGVVLHLVATFLRGVLEALLKFVADVIPVHRFIPNDETDEIGRVGEFRPARKVHRQVEARVEEERLEQGGSDLTLQRVVALVVIHDDLCLLLKVDVLGRPAERLVDLLRRAERRENRRITFGVHRLHERDVRVNGLLVWSDRIRNQRDRADRALDRVEQGQAREHTHGELLLGRRERGPRLHVVGERHFLWQPEVVNEAVPYLHVFFVFDLVPVDRLDVGRKLQFVNHWCSLV